MPCARKGSPKSGSVSISKAPECSINEPGEYRPCELAGGDPGWRPGDATPADHGKNPESSHYGSRPVFSRASAATSPHRWYSEGCLMCRLSRRDDRTGVWRRCQRRVGTELLL